MNREHYCCCAFVFIDNTSYVSVTNKNGKISPLFSSRGISQDDPSSTLFANWLEVDQKQVWQEIKSFPNQDSSLLRPENAYNLIHLTRELAELLGISLEEVEQ